MKGSNYDKKTSSSSLTANQASEQITLIFIFQETKYTRLQKDGKIDLFVSVLVPGSDTGSTVDIVC